MALAICIVSEDQDCAYLHGCRGLLNDRFHADAGDGVSVHHVLSHHVRTIRGGSDAWVEDQHLVAHGHSVHLQPASKPQLPFGMHHHQLALLLRSMHVYVQVHI